MHPGVVCACRQAIYRGSFIILLFLKPCTETSVASSEFSPLFPYLLCVPSSSFLLLTEYVFKHIDYCCYFQRSYS